MKNAFLFYLKISFRSRDIQISPLFFPVSHCFRGWCKYDVINCLKKNLITQFAWYFAKEKRYDIETLSADRVLNKEHFYRKAIMHTSPSKLILSHF